MKKRILVTGGAGFIGSNLCKRLIIEGHYVICMDNLYTGSTNNIIDLLNNENFEFIKHDVTIPVFVKVDEIYNLACPASPIHYQKDPIYTIKTNFYGALNMLELAKSNNAKILQASTSEVYGNPLIHPQVEDYFGNVNPIGIRSCYDEGKRIAETLFFDFYRKYSIKIRVMRVFNTYGPNMSVDDGRVVSNFIVQALMGDDITIYGDGSQTRSFCYIDDLIDGMIKFMDNENDIIGPINLGNPDEFTILSLAKMILKNLNSNSKIVYRDLPQDDPLLRKPDISKANELLNWNPTVNLEKGLDYTIDYFKSIQKKSKVIDKCYV